MPFQVGSEQCCTLCDVVKHLCSGWQVGPCSKVEENDKIWENRKMPGSSWIEINKQVHAFLVGEKITPTITEDLCRVREAV